MTAAAVWRRTETARACNGDAVVDCNNVCNGAATQDDGGCCVAADRDCAGTCNGNAQTDDCGACDDNPANDCQTCQDSDECAVGEVCTDQVCTEVPENAVDWCRLQWPQVENAQAPHSFNVYGRVYEQTITDRSPRTDVDERVLAQVGYGPDRSDPNGQDWTWSDAAPNDGYDGDAAGERNNDEYFGNVTINGEGQYDFAIRFSVDRGRTWTVCDLDGAQNGYSPDEAGQSQIAAAARNECDEGADNCDDNATCFDLDQGFRCECNAGFGGDGVVCADVNECLQGLDNCGANSTCVNNVGGFDCVCDDGYIEEDGECKADPACEIPENICERRCNGEDLQIPERCPVQPECPECCQAERDCAGVCGGPSVQDENGVCCLPAEQDCADICGGAASGTRAVAA